MIKKIICLVFLSSLVISEKIRAQNMSPSMQLRVTLEENFQCQEIVSIFWAELHQMVIDQRLNGVTWNSLKKSIQESQEPEVKKMITWIKALEKKLGSQFWGLTTDKQAEILAQLELGIEADEISQIIRKPKGNIQSCLKPQVRSPGLSSELSQGAQKIMNIAYQSCEASKLAALDQQSPLLQGVEIIGTHPDQIGKVRKISNLSLVQSTHPYLRIQNKEMGCFPVMEKPLIYDYGGKPSYRSANGFEINLFKNAGSGGGELGLDCSALVIASLGVQGLRLKPNEDMTARNTAAFGTSTLIHSPDFFPCLDYVNIGFQQSPLQQGDIVTIRGHVVIVENVGSDPLGLSRISSENGCESISTDFFDFQIIHSSPAGGSVGISKMQARDYLKTSDKMSSGLLKYAQNHCQANFKSQTLKPKYSDVSIVRHKKTPACLGRALNLVSQECVKSCL